MSDLRIEKVTLWETPHGKRFEHYHEALKDVVDTLMCSVADKTVPPEKCFDILLPLFSRFLTENKA